MIVRDNEDIIEPCLTSIRPWVDEMIVVDTGSKDRTPAIAERLGARMFHFPWIDDFSAARNESLKHARGRWIYWTDSDDTIDEVNGRKLRELAYGNHQPNIAGYAMQVHCPLSNDDGSSDHTVVDQVKMFHNHPQIYFEGRMHEQVLMPIRRLNGEVGWTDIYVVHSGSDTSREGRQRKCDRDLRILKLDLADRPDHPFVLFNFGMTYTDMEEYEEALKWLHRCLEVSEPHESHVRKTYAFVALCLYQLERFEESVGWCDRGLNLFPKDIELHFRQGMVLHQLGRLEESVGAYQAALRKDDETHFSSVHDGIGSFKARHNLALVYGELGRPGLQELQWRLALEARPSFQPAMVGLGQLLSSEPAPPC